MDGKKMIVTAAAFAGCTEEVLDFKRKYSDVSVSDFFCCDIFRTSASVLLLCNLYEKNDAMKAFLACDYEVLHVL